jgi:hypothetical protein
MDQTHKIKALISDVFGPSYEKQALSGRGYTTPMIAGTDHANELAASTAYSAQELQTPHNMTRHLVLIFIMFWGDACTALYGHALDMLTACLTLAQYQAAPGELHFRAQTSRGIPTFTSRCSANLQSGNSREGCKFN